MTSWELLAIDMCVHGRGGMQKWKSVHDGGEG